jgi:hypothetical protein
VSCFLFTDREPIVIIGFRQLPVMPEVWNRATTSFSDDICAVYLSSSCFPHGNCPQLKSTEEQLKKAKRIAQLNDPLALLQQER